MGYFMIDFFKMLGFGLMLFWVLISIYWWIAPWFLSEERKRGMVDIENSNFPLKLAAYFFYSSLLWPLRSLVCFICLLLLFIAWIK